MSHHTRREHIAHRARRRRMDHALSTGDLAGYFREMDEDGLEYAHMAASEVGDAAVLGAIALERMRRST